MKQNVIASSFGKLSSSKIPRDNVHLIQELNHQPLTCKLDGDVWMYRGRDVRGGGAEWV